jgi:uncharacterized membrane protein
MKRWIGNILAMVIALGVALVTIWASNRYLKSPQNSIDWAVLVFSGITTGIIAFFVTWGHFQSDPLPEQD